MPDEREPQDVTSRPEKARDRPDVSERDGKEGPRRQFRRVPIRRVAMFHPGYCGTAKNVRFIHTGN